MDAGMDMDVDILFAMDIAAVGFSLRCRARFVSAAAALASNRTNLLGPFDDDGALRTKLSSLSLQSVDQNPQDAAR
jgi:hypothetical protein